MTPRAGRLPGLVLVAVLAAAGSLRAVATLPAWAAAALAATVLLRVALDRVGWRVPSPRLAPAAWVFGPALVLVWALHADRVGMTPAEAVLLVVGGIAGWATLAAGGDAGALRTTAVAGATALGAAFVAPAPATALAVLAFVVLSVPIAVAAADGVGATPGSSGDPSVRRVRADAGPAVAGGRPTRAALGLLALGLPFGVAMFAAVPPPPAASRAAQATARVEAAPRGPAAGGLDGEPRGGEDPARTGARTGRRSPYVASLRRDPRVVLRVRVGDGERGDEPLWLRGETYDAFDGRAWTRSAAADEALEVVPEGRAGWGFVSPGSSTERVVRVRLEDLVGAPPGALPLLPEARRVRLLGGLEDAPMLRRGDGGVALAGSRPAGGRWEEEAAPGRVARDRLASLRSDRGVAPLPTCAEPPPEAEAYRALARGVVGDAATAADEAERLERWFRGPAFRYALEARADPARPVADFVLRARRGHCWCFASGMTAMMRSLGRPARLAVGYRGGDWQDTLGEWAVRGTHAHAWCEVWFEGAGWIPYDPTPAVAEDGTETEGDGGPGFLERLCRFSPEDRRLLGAAIGGSVRRALDLAGVPWAWVAGAAVLALLLAWARRRSGGDAAGGAALAVAGPYARALSALARAGLPRQRSETPEELRRRAGRARPEVARPLDALTRMHEAARYGGVAPEAAAFGWLADEVGEALRGARDARGPAVRGGSPAG